jgi:exosortase D (VPLPA-CTERM-specific)
MEIVSNPVGIRWTIATLHRAALAAVALFLLVAFSAGLYDLWGVWSNQEEYSYGFMIPFVSAYLIWQRRGRIAATAFSGNWAGLMLVVLGLVFLGVGQISTLGTLVQYGFLLCFYGLVLSYTGWKGFAVLAMPLAVLAFMVPLPNYLLREISQVLQLWSSQLGVMVIRAFGISVFLEGNVIDLGGLRLQVVEACNGLRYLLPLMAIGFIAACMFRAAFWKRAVLFLSTIPITVLMNSARIGLIGVLSEHFGRSMAEGFLHDFEGWAVFMVCTLLLIGEVVLLARIGSVKLPLADVFSLPEYEIDPGSAQRERALPISFLAASVLVAIAALISQTFSLPSAPPPVREPFAEFPMQFEAWRGRPARLEQDVLQILKLDDYVLADYLSSDGRQAVNFYVSYYASQANGNSAHSPRACLPGGGWEIHGSTVIDLPGVEISGQPVRVNRVVIQKGENRQLVYYWFQQRGRVSTDEYMVKLEMLWDALTRRRTDGAMVRLVARLAPGEAPEVGDAILERFASQVIPKLTAYVPN